MSGYSLDTDSPFGAYRPTPARRLLIALSRHTWLGRGQVRSLIRSLLLRSSVIVDDEVWGAHIRAYLDNNRCEWKAYLKPSQFDAPEREAIRHVADTDGVVFLDIGANVGLYSLFVSQCARPDARIVAVEPHPVTFARLKYNADLSGGRIRAIQCGVGDTAGEAFLSFDDLSLASLETSFANSTRVAVKPLVDLLKDEGLDRIDIMKIDVEGAEGRVLRPFLVEENARLFPRLIIIEHLGSEIWGFDCLGRLEELGYAAVARTTNNVIYRRG